MGNVKIGWGRRAISLEAPVSLPGQMYIRISEKVLDPLYATALCLDGGEESVIFCTCDTLIIYDFALKAVRELVKSLRPELPVDAIILSATHTHAGVALTDTPATTPDGTPIYPGAKYREFFVRQCADAIIEAWDSRAEGGMAYGYGYAVVGYSRRVVYFDDVSLRGNAGYDAPNGHGVMYGNTADPQFSHYEAGADHFLNAMFTFDKEKQLTGMVVNVPCPSQMSEHFTMQTADYWSDVRGLVAKEFGENVYVLPQCAASGDLAPWILHYKQAEQRRMTLKYDTDYTADAARINHVLAKRADAAERILEAIRDVYSWASKDIQTDVTVHHRGEVLQIPQRMITDEEKQWCEENVRRMEAELEEKKKGTPEEVRVAVSTFNSFIGRNKRAIAKWETQKQAPNFPTECHTVRIGDIAFATTQYELYMDYMHRIQARSPFIQTFMIQLAGSEAGPCMPSYLPTERGVANKGYSASIFCNQIGAEGGQVYVEETLRMLNDLK